MKSLLVNMSLMAKNGEVEGEHFRGYRDGGIRRLSKGLNES